MNWPKADKKSMDAFYGAHLIDSDGHPTEQWENGALTQIPLPYPMALSWDTDIHIQKITCNRLIAVPLAQVLSEIFSLYGTIDEVRKHNMHLYGGCYNYRAIRGGGSLSAHAWGVALDLDPEHNGLGKKWKEGTGMMPKEVIEIFEKYGAQWGGKWSRPDAMHFQWCRS